ncbi:MAG: NnrS family protein [Magnetococcales bacterium]|nr:NnrS family protein [Magnetococcales bacterium]MBF0114818.1 NnrS family protein [Magnetococcales bacterium]
MNPSSARQSVLFAYGFRPFFLGAGVWSLAMISLWLYLLNSADSTLDAMRSPLWHGHEMLYGFIGASAAGFLLTASPNWSRKPALTGTPLKLLFLSWLLGRFSMLCSPWLPAWLVAGGDLLFCIALVATTTPTLWNTGNKVHRIFPLLLALLALGNLLYHGQFVGIWQESAQRGLYVGIDAIVFFLVMVGGHIMPMFTRNALANTEMLPPIPIKPALEIAGAVTLTAIVLSDLYDPYNAVGGVILCVAALVQAWRLSLWHTLKTLKIPILWVLHVGYAWLVIGLMLRGISQTLHWLPPTAALHALTIGAMGLFTLGIMGRVSLAHTGRPLQASFSFALTFYLIIAAVCIRVFAILIWPMQAITLSALLWIGAFALFIVNFATALTQPRPDGLPG